MTTSPAPILSTFSHHDVFTWETSIHFDELDPMQILHNSRYGAHVERATIAFFHSLGYRWESDPERNPDQFHVVRDFQIEFLAPVGPGQIEIDLWVERLGTTSCVYGFRCLSRARSLVHARGIRTIVKVDPNEQTPVPWSETFREGHRRLLRPLPFME